LKDNINIAISWGETLFHLIDNINVKKKYNINIFSTLGGVNLSTAGYQNNDLVQRFAEKVGGNSYPIYLPLILEQAGLKRELIDFNNNIKGIINSTSNIDYYIASVGGIVPKARMFALGGFSIDFLNYLVSKNVCGEIGLNFFDISGKFINTGIEDRIINLNIEEIKQIKNKVIIAFGKYKEAALKGILRTKLVNTLITDNITGRLLLKKEY
jgi:DNA-binding transcriptional regulator LsrR (DeoR family)